MNGPTNRFQKPDRQEGQLELMLNPESAETMSCPSLRSGF